MSVPGLHFGGFERIDGGAFVRRLQSVMAEADLVPKRISGAGTRIMWVEGVKQSHQIYDSDVDLISEE